MKLVFTKLETPATEIKVAFDGVNYKSYNVDEIKSTGYIPFTEADCPDLTKVKIQGKFSTLGSVEVNKSVELERGEGGESGISCTFERDVFEEVTYYCFAQDNDGNGEIEDNELHSNAHVWVKELTPNAKLEPFVTYEFSPGIPDTSDSLVSIHTIYPEDEDFAKLNDDKSGLSAGWINEDGEEVIDTVTYLRYPEGDLTETEKVGTETVTEVITEIQEEPTITKSGQTVADVGKAFKTVRTYTSVGISPKITSVNSDFLKEHFDDNYIDDYGSIENGTVLKPINLLISNDNLMWDSNGAIALFVPLEVGDVISDKIESCSGYQTSGSLIPRVFDSANNILHCFMERPM